MHPLRLGFFLASVALLAGSSRAQTLAFTVPNGRDDHGGLQDFGGSLGFYFNLNSSLTISSLGYWDDNLDGVNGPGAEIHVAIFDRGGTPGILTELSFTGAIGTLVGNIVSPQLNAGDPPGAAGSGRPGQFRMADLPLPLNLPAGDYALVAWGYDSLNLFLNGAGTGSVVTEDSLGGRLTFQMSAYGITPGAFPTTTELDFSPPLRQYTLGTFSSDLITPIPEPASITATLGAAALLAGLGARRRWRRG